MKHFFSLFAIVTLLFATSCSSEEALHTYVDFQIQKMGKSSTGKDSIFTVKTLNSGETYILKATCITEEGTLTRLTVDTKLTEDKERRTLLVEELSGQNKSVDIDFIAPSTMQDSTIARIFARVETTDGAQDVREKMYSLVGTDRRLAEQAGLTLYAQEGDQHPNAISVINGDDGTSALKLIMASLTDEENIDILFPMIEESEECSYMLTSPNRRVEFARINTFNYGAVSVQGLKNAYAASITAPTVKNIADDDTILFGTEGKALGVIKIQKIYDEPGTKADRIYFAVKLI